MTLVRVDTRLCKVQNIAADGNCLFGALAHQIFREEIGSDMHTALVHTLREMTVQYILNHLDDALLRRSILSRVSEEYPALECASDRQTMLNFLAVLRQNRIWGDSESIMAVSALFDCQITILRENGFTTTFRGGYDQAIDAQMRPTISIVYRGNINHWNHYDSLLHFVDSSAKGAPAGSNSKNESMNVLWWSVVHFTTGSCIALNTKKDGNCLFSALGHQLFGFNIESQDHESSIGLLRRQSIEHIRNNLHLQRYESLLQERLREYPKFSHDSSMNKYASLLSHLSQPNVWGGTECITAIADIYGCNVQTIWEKGAVTTIKSIRNTGFSPICIVYRGNGRTWNHYDSFLCQEEIQNAIGNTGLDNNL